MKKYIQIYYDFLDYKDDVTLEEAGKLFWAVIAYGADGTIPDDDCFNHGTLKMLWKMLCSQIKRDEKKYNEKCEKNKRNIEKRWERIIEMTPKPTAKTDDTYDTLASNIMTIEPSISEEELDREVKRIIS